VQEPQLSGSFVVLAQLLLLHAVSPPAQVATHIPAEQ